MSYSESFPTQRPIFTLDAANAGRLDSRISYTRSTTGSFYGKDKHLSSDNLLLQSSNFITSWFPNGINGTPTGGQGDPAGGTDGFTVVEDSAVGAVHRIFQAANASGDLAFTVYAKQNSGTRYLTLTLFNANNNWTAATFDLAGGSPATGSGSSSVFSSVSATQSASGNGYYKCTIKATGALAGYVYIYLGSSTAAPTGTYGSVTHTGDGTSSLDIAFASLTTTGATDYNATTTQIHRAYAPTLQTAAINAPRFEHSASDSASMGLLVEGQAQNLLPNGATGYNPSNSFSWNKVNANVVQNAAIAPTGQLEATHFYDDTATASQQRFDVTVTATAAAHTLSGYFKSAGRDEIIVRVSNGGTNYWGKLTFSTETTSDAGNPFSDLSVTNVGNGWYRFTATTPTLTAGSTTIYINLSDGALNYDGDGYSGMLFYGLQFEANSFASSVIATSGGAATRAADSAAMVNSSLFDNGEGALFVEADQLVANTYNGIASLETDISNIVHIFGNTTNFRAEVVNGGSTVANMTASGNSPQGVARKHCLTYSPTETKYFVGGSQIGSTDTSLSVPQTSTLRIGGFNTGTGYALNGHVKRVAVYGQSLSSTELAALTSS